MYAEWMKHISLELTKEDIREYFKRKKRKRNEQRRIKKFIR